jgi:hypothetical protein
VLTQSGWVTASRAPKAFTGAGWWAATRSRRALAGCYLTGLVEPCGAYLRKCLLICLFICHLELGSLDQLECERPFAEGTAAQDLEHPRNLVELEDQDQGLGWRVESRPYLSVGVLLHLLGQAPEGSLATPKPTLVRGRTPARALSDP